MREDMWKYVALILVLMLAASTVSAVLLYMQNSALQIPPKTGGVVETSTGGNCSASEYESQLRELQERVEFLKSQLRAKNAPPGNGTIAIVPVFGIIDGYTALNLVPLLRNIAKNDSIGGVLLW